MATALLGRFGDSRVIGALATSVSRAEIADDLRDAALNALSKINTPDADDALLSVAENSALSGSVRLQALSRLARRRQPEALDQLAAIAADSHMETDVRISAVTLLAELRAKRRLRVLAAPRGEDHHVRMAAIRAIIALAGEEDAQALVAFARDPQVDPDLRIAAAQALGMLDHPDASEIFTVLAADTSVGPDVQRSAAELAYSDVQTDELEDSRALPSDGALTSDKNHARPPIQPYDRARISLFTTLSLWPAILTEDTTDPDRLVVLPQCRDELMRVVQDESVGSMIRWIAGAALERLERPTTPVWPAYRAYKSSRGNRDDVFKRGTAEVCVQLISAAVGVVSSPGVDDVRRENAIASRLELVRSYAEDSGQSVPFRRYSAEIIARLGDGRGNEVLLKLMRAEAMGMHRRCDAAVSLACAGDSRGTNFLRKVKNDWEMPRPTRLRAARLLRTAGDPAATRLFQELIRQLPQPPKLVRHSSDLDVALGVRAQLADSSATVDRKVLMMAANTLAKFSNADVVRSLTATAADASQPFSERRKAITSLALQGAAPQLADIGEDTRLDSTVRCWAAEEAAWLAEPRGAEVLAALVNDALVDSYTRRRAALFLARLSDSRGTRLLAHLATDPGSTIDARQTATQLLTQMRYVEDLQSIILASSTSDDSRSNAISILASHGETNALLDLRQRKDLPIRARQQIARVLQRALSRGTRGVR